MEKPSEDVACAVRRKKVGVASKRLLCSSAGVELDGGSAMLGCSVRYFRVTVGETKNRDEETARARKTISRSASLVELLPDVRFSRERGRRANEGSDRTGSATNRPAKRCYMLRPKANTSFLGDQRLPFSRSRRAKDTATKSPMFRKVINNTPIDSRETHLGSILLGAPPPGPRPGGPPMPPTGHIGIEQTACE